MALDDEATEGHGRLVALTGITGFIGGHVAARLAARGWRVRALARSMPRLAGPAGGPVEIVPGRLDEDRALRALLEGADAVVHLAGAIKGRARGDFLRANAAATASLAAAWRAHAPGAPFVHMSSMAAREPALSDYAASKRAAEERLFEIAGAARWCVLRPSVVYGPGDRETLRIFRLAAGPAQPMLNGARARLTLVHVDDLAGAVAAALEHGPPPALYEVTDAATAGYSWRAICAAAAEALGRAPRPVRVPAAVMRIAGLFGDAVALAGGTGMITSGKAREVLHPDWSSDPGRQLPAAIWRPRIGLSEGFADAVAWYRAAGRLRR